MFHKQNARQPAAAALLALLLALASAFSCIGLSSWASFQKQLAELDSHYTTVAYPANRGHFQLFGPGGGIVLEDGSLQTDDGTILPSNQRINQIVGNAPGVLRWDANVLTAAHTPNQKGFSSGAADPMNYIDVYDLHRYSQSVMAVRCLAVEEQPYVDGVYVYKFEWVEPVCRMDAYDLPEQGKTFRFDTLITGSPASMDEEGDTPFPSFEVGKTYLMRGDFVDFEIWQEMQLVEAAGDEPERIELGPVRRTADYWENVLQLDPDRPDAPEQRLYFFYNWMPTKYEADYLTSDDFVGHPYPFVPNFYLANKMVTTGDFKIIIYPPEDSWPFYAEYEGDWRDFLNTEEGKVWRDEIIPNCELNHDSVPVLFTDNVQGLSQFCKEESALLEGRFITQEEYDTGAAVCMVGADYALYNGLQVGDTLTLDLYRPAYETQSGLAYQYTNQDSFLYTVCMPMVEENRLDVTRDYTIVGLYTAPVWPVDPDGHGFRGDTVLAPKASAPEVVEAAEEDKVTPLLNTLVLKNGSIEEFEAYMAENGAADRFRYYDYGYSEMKDSIEAMKSSALRLAALGGAAFLIGGLVFLLASFARMSASARGLRLLGASPRKVTGEMLSALLPLTAAGVILGGVLGGLLYGRVCEIVLSQTLTPDWLMIAACAALQLLVLCAVAACWAALTARRGLMRRKRE
ncbi:MAG: ABC transporter permease [Clostridiales bacterium]|nr:ABC transporter permease [Clostridiales bacterium]